MDEKPDEKIPGSARHFRQGKARYKNDMVIKKNKQFL
jgi:hypothetical protein